MKNLNLTKSEWEVIFKSLHYASSYRLGPQNELSKSAEKLLLKIAKNKENSK